jgi:hypothetical protein
MNGTCVRGDRPLSPRGIGGHWRLGAVMVGSVAKTRTAPAGCELVLDLADLAEAVEEAGDGGERLRRGGH